MILRQIRHLQCFCGSDAFSAYALGKNEFKLLAPDKDTTLRNGLLICDGCHKAYPVSDDILYMLPESLPDKSAEAFFKKHFKYLPKDAVIPGFGQAQKSSEDFVAQNKINEMTARDEQANRYYSYLHQTYATNEQKVFKKFLRPNSEDVIVELGCGTGKITRELIKAGFKDLIALDFSETSIRLLLEKLDSEKDGILFIKGDVCNLPIKSRIANKCVSAQVFEHIPGKAEQEKFVCELKRVLKPSGIAALTIYNLNITKRLQRSEKGYHSGSIYFENFSKKKIKGFFKGHFIIDKLFGINCYFPFFYKISPRFQYLIESVLSRSPLNSFLGNILFLRLRGL